MNKWYVHLLSGFLVFLLLLSSSRVSGQCGLTYYAGIGVPTSGTSFATWSNYNLGQYFALPALSGANYEISTCGAAYDTQITGWDGSATSVFAYNNDNGPVCSGTSASLNFTATANNYLYIQVTQNNCVGGTPASPIDLYLRQIDNIVFTSSSATMCSGETRNLSATPAAVGPAPGGYGNPGTFSGTGVSGNVFTAPVVATTTNYTITYTFGYVSHTQVITVNPTPTGNATPTSTTLCSGSTYSIALGSSIPGSTYSWGVVLTSGSLGALGPLNGTSSVINNTYSGNAVFSFTAVASSNGCQSPVFSSSATINSLPTVGTTASALSICNGSTVTLNGTGTATSYSWSSGVTDGVAFTPTATATYTVTGTNAAGCRRTATRAITVNSLPVLSVNSGSLCAGGSFTLTPSGASTYTYSSGTNTLSPSVGTNSYTVTGTSADGCVSSSPAIATVTVFALPTLAVNSGSMCVGSTFTMTPSGATTYTYSSGTNTVSPAVGTSTFSVIGRDANGCVSASPAVSSVTVAALPLLAVNSGSMCAGKTFTMTPSGALTYTYTSGTNTVNPGVGTTSYSVTGTDANGCISGSPAISTVTVAALPVVAVNSGSICVGSTFTMTPSGASTYTYSSGTNTVSPAVGTSVFFVSGTGANGCVTALPAASSVTVQALPVLAVNSGSMCAGSTFTMTPSGAVTYTYSSGTNTLSPAAGVFNYSVTGTDAGGCISGVPAVSTLTVQALPVIAVNSGSICAGSTFSMTPSGAITYTYSSGTNTVSPAVGTTTFAVTGTNNEGCISDVPAISTITVQALPLIAVNSGSICVGHTFTMTPTGAVTYTYSSGTNTVSPAVGTTTFAVSGTDLHGCISNVDAISSVTVAARPVLAVNSGSICAGSTFTMVPSGAVTYTYTSGTNTVSPAVGTTTFAVSGTDASGCISDVDAIASVTVAVLPTLAVNSGSICAGSTFTMTPSGAVTYTYSSGTNTVSPAVGTNTFSVIGKDANNCISDVPAIASVTVAALPVLAVNSGSICVGHTFTMTPSGAVTYTYSSGTNTVSPAVGTTTFAVSGTDLNGCISNVNAISSVTVAARPVLAVNSGSICVGSTFTMTPSGAVTYTYSSGTTTVSPAVGTTTFAVSGTDANGCISTIDAISTVTVAALPTLAVNSGSICVGATFTMTPSGAVTYTYSSGTNTVSPAVGTSTFSVMGTDANNCISDVPAVASVTVAALPVLAVNSGSICVGHTFTMTPSGAVTYTYSSGTNTVSPAVGTTTFAVSGTDLNGCISGVDAVSSVTVAARPVLAVNSGSICVGSTFTMTPSGAVTYTYSSGTNTVSPAVGTTTFAVSGTDANGCISNVDAISSVTVAVLPTLAVNSGSICVGSTFTMTPSGAVTYTYSSGTNTVSPAVGTTTFSVMGTDANNCISNIPAVSSVTVAALPVLAVSSGSICVGSTFTMIPSGAVTYTYSSGTNTVSPAVGTTTFSVIGTDANNCISNIPAVSSVTVAALPVLAVNSGSICVGHTFTMIPSGAVTYTYSSGTNTVSPAVGTTTFAVSGTDMNGCVSNVDAVSSVTVAARPVLSVNSGSICAGATFTMVPSGAVTYTYSSGSNTVSPAVGTPTFAVSGTDANNCISNVSAIASVTVYALPVISVNNGNICDGTTFTMNPGGALTYTYSNGSNTVIPAVGTSTYAVTGTDFRGCISASAAISSVTVNPLPVIAVNSGTICNGSVFQFFPSGAVTYTYSGGSNTVSPGTTTSYSVTGSNVYGCVSAAAAVSTVSVHPTPIIAVNSGSICVGNSFTMTPSGAMTYTFTNGSNVISPSTTASYSVTGTDINGCVSTSPAVSTVTVYALPVISVNSGSICAGSSFTLNPSGAGSYTITGGNTIVSPASTTSYSVTGIDGNGCYSAAPAIATVTVYALPLINASSGSICSGQSFTMLPSGASTYTYSGGSNTVSPTATTVYTISGTSAQGCAAASPATVTVTVNTPPQITVNSGSICAGQSFTLNPGGAQTYTITGGSSVVTPFSTSSYTVNGTSINGCVATVPAIATVTVNALPQLTINTSQSVICPGQQAVLTVSGANAYVWQASGATTTTLVVTPTTTTTYYVTGTGANGCSITSSFVQAAGPCTDIDELVASGSVISVYPNPNNGEVQMDLVEPMTIIISDLLGNIVMNGDLLEGHHQLSLEKQANGVYILVAIAKGHHETVRIVKQ